MRHPAKNFFFEKTLPGALALALGKAGNSALPSARARAPGKASKINFFYFVF